MTTPLAYRVQDAAEVAGVSPNVIRAAIKRGDLVARYPTTYPVVEHQELQEWLQSRPTEKPAN